MVTGGTSVHCPAAQYDAADRPTCRGRQYDDRGQLSRCTGERFTYDVLGRLRSHSQRSTTSTYDWDAAGRLVGMSDGAHDEHFVYGSGMGPIAWRRDGMTAYFAYGSQPHVPDVMWVDATSDGSIDARYRILTDERGSVRDVGRQSHVRCARSTRAAARSAFDAS